MAKTRENIMALLVLWLFAAHLLFLLVFLGVIFTSMVLDGDDNNMMQYNPEHYWHKRGADYQASFEVQEAVEVENLKMIVESFMGFEDPSVIFLEVGSGYGRIYNELKNAKLCFFLNYHMCDFVESMRYNCLRNTDALPDYWNGKILPYADNSFDFVISFSVFLHVPPADIETIFAEHIRVCKKYFFIATYAGGLGNLAPHCFEHDYKSLFEKHNLKIIDEKFFQGGLRVNWLLEV